MSKPNFKEEAIAVMTDAAKGVQSGLPDTIALIGAEISLRTHIIFALERAYARGREDALMAIRVAAAERGEG